MPRLQLILSLLFTLPAHAVIAAPPPESPQARAEAKRLADMPPVHPPAKVQMDHSGRKETGHASYYGKEFNNRKMADGNRLNPNARVAASKALPLGSVAEVTNLKNGKSTTVRVEDRGPYKPGRIIDVTPKAAADLDMRHSGVAPVEVKPITVPTPDGGVKLGAGAANADPGKVAAAVRTTEKLTHSSPTEEAAR